MPALRRSENSSLEPTRRESFRRRWIRFLFNRSITAALLLLACVVPCAAATLPAAKVTLGDEVFLNSAWRDLAGRCVGVVTNQTGVTSRLLNIVDAIRA